jgi:hypothetical protein
MTQTININIETQEYLSKSIMQKLSGFIINVNKNNYIITIHHFLPIQKVTEADTKQELTIAVNSCWSEILVLNSKNINLNRYLVHKNIQNKLPKINDELSMELEFDKCIMKVCDYEFIPYDNLNIAMKLPYIKASIISDVDKFAGFSGKPVFNKNKIVGIFSKAYSDNKTILIIPIYILIKNLEKKDNNNIYKYSSVPKKINAYYVKENLNIYHPTLKIDIPYTTHLLIEGDVNFDSIIVNSLGETMHGDMIIDTDNVTECDLIKSNQFTYLITPRLLMLLKHLFNQTVLKYIFGLINKTEKNSEKLWLLYNEGNFRITLG